MHKRLFRIKLVLVTSLCVLIPLLVTWWKGRRAPSKPYPYSFPFAELASLDNVVQQRLSVVPTDDFGFARIGPRHAYFRPLTTAENSAIDALKASGHDVVFYLVGRGILRGLQGPDLPHAVQGPIYFTPSAKFRVSKTAPFRNLTGSSGPVKWQTQPLPRRDLPDERTLQWVALEAFRRSRLNDGMNNSAGHWKIAAVVVRATQQACVDCHNIRSRVVPPEETRLPIPTVDRVRLGDPLGIALYCYQPYQELQKSKNTNGK
jgi:hypothetical protein